MSFDITDGKNRYAPCPACGAVSGMGLVSKRNRLAVQCSACNFRGPGTQNAPAPETDKLAFDAWNSREHGLAHLNAIADIVLAYKPRPKTKAAKKRTRKAKKNERNASGSDT